MRVESAHPDDIPSWLDLAAEVEVCFGPLVDEPGFMVCLQKNIARGTALCIREADAPPGAALMGGILFSPKPPKYELSWLAVAERWRRHGVGRALINGFFKRVIRPARIVLLTFAEDDSHHREAPEFYKRLGFTPGEPGPVNPVGVPTQVYRFFLQIPPTARALIRQSGRVLLVQHHYRKPENNGKWSIPGGWMEEGDRDYPAALRRELREEFGVEIDIVRALGVFSCNGQDHHFYLVQPHSLDFRIDDTEIAGMAWFTPDEVRSLDADGKLLAAFIRQAVEAGWGES